MSSPSEDFHRRLATADARIQHGNDERASGADDRARAIAEKVARHGERGVQQVANELGVSKKTIFQAVARARRAPDPGRGLPWDTLERLLAAEAATLPPLPVQQWKALAWIVRSTFIDEMWMEQPGELLAQEVEDADLPPDVNPAVLADACRAFSPGQGVAVIDACQREDFDVLPVLNDPSVPNGTRVPVRKGAAQ